MAPRSVPSRPLLCRPALDSPNPPQESPSCSSLPVSPLRSSKNPFPQPLCRINHDPFQGLAMLLTAWNPPSLFAPVTFPAPQSCAGTMADMERVEKFFLCAPSLSMSGLLSLYRLSSPRFLFRARPRCCTDARDSCIGGNIEPPPSPISF